MPGSGPYSLDSADTTGSILVARRSDPQDGIAIPENQLPRIGGRYSRRLQRLRMKRKHGSVRTEGALLRGVSPGAPNLTTIAYRPAGADNWAVRRYHAVTIVTVWSGTEG